MEIAIGAIGIGVVLMVGYLVIAQVSSALPTAPTTAYVNTCYGLDTADALCNVSTVPCSTYPVAMDNTSELLSCADSAYSTGLSSTSVTVGAGLGLVAVGIIVLAAFGLITIFK